MPIGDLRAVIHCLLLKLLGYWHIFDAFFGVVEALGHFGGVVHDGGVVHHDLAGVVLGSDE